MPATATAAPTSAAPRPVVREDGPIHDWFGLTYANHQVLHRSLMQSMPTEWQERMVGCLEELQAAYQHLPQAQAYEIIPGTEHEVGSLTPDQFTAAGVTFERDDEGCIARYWRDGQELDPDDLVLLPGTDPVPHYNRGRTYLPPFGTTD
ncbi:hypothetical protein [Streptacidiphilus neutrinimicus]|uniref:hypothetical protein n=1 Tax=Streptacidiphilus neutrinimicus TaxID=105420 RepID=UPI0005A8C3DA|nr:hypothetical protein [Streptacidiphilus neutrinimicus]